jgi:Protein of unknown function (DUF4238)
MTARNHHYVSQCYLRGFTHRGTSRLFVVDGVAKRTFETTPRNVAAERDFNRIDVDGLPPDALETDFSAFESALSAALDRISATGSFADADDRVHVFNFIALLATRNPRHRANFEDFEDRSLKMLAELMASAPEHWASQVRALKEAGRWDEGWDIDYATMKDFVKKGDYRFVTPRMRHIAIELPLVERILPFISERKWKLLKAEPGTRGLVTSDHPVCLMWSDPKARGGFYGPGLGLTGTDLLFPLTSDLALCGRFDGDELGHLLNDYGVAGFNGAVVTFAERQVYARDDTFLYPRQPSESPRPGNDLLNDPLFPRPTEREGN